MGKRRFGEEEIVTILHESETGGAPDDSYFVTRTTRKNGPNKQTGYSTRLDLLESNYEERWREEPSGRCRRVAA